MNSLMPRPSLKVPNVFTEIISIHVTRQSLSFICAPGTVLSLPCQCQSLVVASMRNEHFPSTPDTRPIDCAPYCANVDANAVIDKCVQECLNGVPLRTSQPVGQPVCSCRKEERTPSFLCYVSPYPQPSYCPPELAPSEPRFLSGCCWRSQVHLYSPCPQRVLANARRRRAYRPEAFLIKTGTYSFKRMPFGVCSAARLFQQMMSVTFDHLGPESDILTYG